MYCRAVCELSAEVVESNDTQTATLSRNNCCRVRILCCSELKLFFHPDEGVYVTHFNDDCVEVPMVAMVTANELSDSRLE